MESSGNTMEVKRKKVNQNWAQRRLPRIVDLGLDLEDGTWKMQGGIRDWWELSLVKKVEIYIIYLEALPNTQRWCRMYFLRSCILEVTEFQWVFFFFFDYYYLIYICILLLLILSSKLRCMFLKHYNHISLYYLLFSSNETNTVDLTQ